MMSQLSKNDGLPAPASDYPYNKDSHLDLLDESAVRNAHDITGGAGLPTPESSAHSPADTDMTSTAAPNRAVRYRKISRELHALLPSAELRRVLAYESPGALLALNGFYTHADLSAGKAEPLSALADENYPASTCHPAIIAKRLLQYTLCLQLLPQNRLATLDLGDRLPCQVVSSWVSATYNLVTSADDLVGSLEGLECLILQVWFHGDAGHLRKAWMASRRALGMGQLLGLGRPRPAVRSVGSRYPADPNVLWYKTNCCDRYHSLILGLPAGSRNNTFANEGLMEGDNELDKMNKKYAVLAGRIADRQDMYDLHSQESYAATQSIDAEMEATARLVPDLWWEVPQVNSPTHQAPDEAFLKNGALRLQIRHYTLLVLLHLPFIVRENSSQLRRYEYNRKTCLHAARCILERFLAFRKNYVIYMAGRHVDYAALIAAMALCLGYLGVAPGLEREADARLIDETLAGFKALADLKREKLSQESYETIERLSGILKGSIDQAGLAFNVPMLGTVNIAQNPQEGAGQASDRSIAPRPVEIDSSNPTLSEGFLGGLDGEFSFECAPVSLSFDTGMPMQLDQGTESLTGHSSGDFSWSPNSWLDVSLDPDDWALQGVDTSFWSMLNQSMN